MFILVSASVWDPCLSRVTPVLICFSSCGQRSASNFHRLQTADHWLPPTTASPPTTPNRPLPAPACLPSNAVAVRRLVVRTPRPIWPYSLPKFLRTHLHGVVQKKNWVNLLKSTRRTRCPFSLHVGDWRTLLTLTQERFAWFQKAVGGRGDWRVSPWTLTSCVVFDLSRRSWHCLFSIGNVPEYSRHSGNPCVQRNALGVCPIDYRIDVNGPCPVSECCLTISNLDLLSSNKTGVNPAIRSCQKHLSEWAQCHKSIIGGIYSTKQWRAETPQRGVELDTS
jgi:hypothetical protein